MPVKRLIAVGCSWTYGTELHEEHRLTKSYSALVAKHYGLQLDNCGFPGASLESMRSVLHWHLKNTTGLDDTLWLVGLTDSTRKSWYNAIGKDSGYNFNFNQPERPWNNHVHSIWLKHHDLNINPSWYKLNKLWTANCYSAEWAEQNYWETVTAFESIKYSHNSKVVQFNCMINPYKNANVINTDSSFRQMLNKQHFASGKHPNEIGHEIISKHLINHIDCANILA